MTELTPPGPLSSDVYAQTDIALPRERISTAQPYPLDKLLGGLDSVKHLVVDTLHDSRDPRFSGFNAYLYEVPQRLTQLQEGTLGQQLGRIVGKTLLVRVAQPESPTGLPPGSVTKSRMLELEAQLYGHQEIAAFSAATSSLVEYEPGKKAFLVEWLPKYLVWPTDEEQVKGRLDREDIARIAYQLAMMYESVHGHIESPNDLKSLAYDDTSGRIICFDLGSTRTYFRGGQISGFQQATMMFEDIERFGDNLIDFVFKHISLKILNSISLGEEQTLANIQSICRSHTHRSLWQIAQRIDQAFEGKFSQEYEQIVGHPPANTSHTSLTRDIQEDDWFKAKEQLDKKYAAALKRRQEEIAKEQRLNIVGPDLPFDQADDSNDHLASDFGFLNFLIETEFVTNRLSRGSNVIEAMKKMEDRFKFLAQRNMLPEERLATFRLVSKRTGRTFLDELLQKYVEIGELHK